MKRSVAKAILPKIIDISGVIREALVAAERKGLLAEAMILEEYIDRSNMVQELACRVLEKNGKD